MLARSVTAIITAYNEEQTVADAIAHTDSALKKYVRDYEIIVVDDASTDATGRIADALAKDNARLRVVHNATNRNIGYNMRLGVSMASKEYCFGVLNADNYLNEECFRQLLSAIGTHDMVMGYLVHYGDDRPWSRRIISWAFTKIMNMLFLNHIRYYNGPLIVRTKVWQTVPMTTNSFAHIAEVTATLLKRKLSYAEVPFTLSPERKGLNIAMLRRNSVSVSKTIASLWWRLNVKKEFSTNVSHHAQVT